MITFKYADLRTRSTWMLLATCSLLAGMYNYSFRLVRVTGPSMEPTFTNGELVLMRRTNWPDAPVKVGDIIVFRQEGDTLIKRVAALPGDLAPVEDLGPTRTPKPVKRFALPGEAIPTAVLK